jgi:hypothetical protein
MLFMWPTWCLTKTVVEGRLRSLLFREVPTEADVKAGQALNRRLGIIMTDIKCIVSPLLIILIQSCVGQPSLCHQSLW